MLYYFLGKGWDRHLFSMRYNADKRGETYNIFQDPAYKTINHIIISTSTLSAPSLLLGGFAPVVPDGFGVGENFLTKMAEKLAEENWRLLPKITKSLW